MLTFGAYELDEARRELRLAGEVVPLQPRVFDLLALLASHPERVMGKDELMDTLWPNMVVGDGSLQRAVSLARSALKPGHMDHLLRNYPRQGYRFCTEEPAGANADEPASGALERARVACQAGDWATSIAEFRRADTLRALDATHLEHFADACQCAGESEMAIPVLERAVAAYGARGDRIGAARMALWLAENAFELAQPAVAGGWLAQARRCLDGQPECYEHGLEAYLAARMAMARGALDEARTNARRALEIGRRLHSEDIEALAHVYLGFVDLSQGETGQGVAMMDGAAASVLAGNISPRVGGIVYCGLIWGCCNQGDWQRAAQWSDGFSRWCERTGMKRFFGMCQLHRAEVLSISGDPGHAQAEIERACEQASRYSPYAAGDAFRILGDFHLLRGELDAADAAFRRAHALGWDPQPGLASLQAERGDPEAAMRGLARSLATENWALLQRRALLLSQLAVVAARHGDLTRAGAALEELEARPDLWTTAYHRAAVEQANAELAASNQDLEEAVAGLRRAIDHWQQAGSRLNVANGRLRLATWLAQQHDIAAARLELDAAESAFGEMEAPSQVQACRALRQGW